MDNRPELLLSFEDEDLRIHSTFLKSNRYWYYTLTNRLLHYIILERMQLIKPSFLHYADHEDRNRSNNKRDNLSWVTTSESNKNKAAKTHCKRGHELTAANLYVISRGTIECLTCKRNRNAEWARISRSKSNG